VKRSILVVSVLVALTGSLMACKSETPGLPGASSNTGTTSANGGGPFSETETSGPTIKSSAAGAPPLANMKACSLLTSADVSSFGVGSTGKEDDSIKGSRDCSYQKSGSFTIGATIYDEVGIKDVTDRGTLTQLTVGSHEAVQGMSSGGVCAIALKTSETSRVDATGNAVADDKKACDLARQVAEIVEKKLPK